MSLLLELTPLRPTTRVRRSWQRRVRIATNAARSFVKKNNNNQLITVTLSREGAMMHVDISVHPGPRGMVVQGGGQAAEAYPAFDLALERIRKQLRRYKRRLVDDHRRRGHNNDDVLPAQQYVIQSEAADDEVEADAQPIIVAEMQTDIATLSVSEAVMRMDLADLPLLMFRNIKTDTLSVVYHRKDGNIGWIDPSPSEKKD